MLDDGSESKSRYLRTGDEGFLEEGKLYITGRLKDLIIVGGKNYYPEDIEVSAQEADRVAIRPGCVAAFCCVSPALSNSMVPDAGAEVAPGQQRPPPRRGWVPGML